MFLNHIFRWLIPGGVLLLVIPAERATDCAHGLARVEKRSVSDGGAQISSPSSAGRNLSRRLLPSTWAWAVLQAVREAARRKDAEFRRQDHNPDRILSLFSLGFELDEGLEERLQALKASGRTPVEALPCLVDGIEVSWNSRPLHRLDKRPRPGRNCYGTSWPARQGEPPTNLDQLVCRLIGALVPLAEGYPLPHYRRAT